MKIERLSTCSFKLYSPGGKVVMIDPWLTGDPFWPKEERTAEKLGEIDVIAITHAHFDHASGIDEILRQNDKACVVGQFEYALSLMARGVKNVIPISFGATLDLLGIKFSFVPACHTSSQMTPEGKVEVVGAAGGYVIEMEDGKKVYVSGDTGLTADMKFVVGDYHRPDISILPVCGMLVMEPEQAAYAAGVTGCKFAIPAHDFPRSVSEAADPAGYSEFLKQYPVQETYKKVERFMEVLAKDYAHIKGIYIPIGGTAEL